VINSLFGPAPARAGAVAAGAGRRRRGGGDYPRLRDGTGDGPAEAMHASGFGREGSDRDEEGIGRLSESDMETPEGDAIEQRQEVVEDENGSGQRREIPFDVDEADAAEQRREVRIDDDDYR
jgi:hypothetical protein